jgi:hypothetical protein
MVTKKPADETPHFDDAEIARRRDEVVKRMFKTPPATNAPSRKSKSDVAKRKVKPRTAPE